MCIHHSIDVKIEELLSVAAASPAQIPTASYYIASKFLSTNTSKEHQFRANNTKYRIILFFIEVGSLEKWLLYDKIIPNI